MLLMIPATLLAAAHPGAPAGFHQEPLILDANRADRVQPAPVQAEPVPPATDALAEIEAGGADVAINHIAFEGTDVPAVVGDAARAYIGKPATRETLQALAKALSDAYSKSDVALYTISIPDQDLTGGDVRVLVAEGYIERITYPDDASDLIRAYGARLMAHKPLTKRVLERYLSLMRDMAGTKIDAKLLRGQSAGGVVLALSVTRKNRDFSFGFNNLGTTLLGKEQLRADYQRYGLLRDGDRIDVNMLASPDFKQVKNISVGYSTPIGSDGIRLSAYAGYLETRPKSVPIKGEAKTAAISVSYPVIRGYRSNLTVSFNIDGLNSDAAVFGTMASSDRTRAARLASGYSNVSEKSALTIGLTASRGIDMLGARSLANINELSFTKMNGRATFDRQLAKKLFLRLRAASQFSKDRLAAAERFAIGGSDFGRAFDGALLSGDAGYAALGEFAIRPKLPAAINNSELYSFIDYGKVWIRPRLGRGSTVNFDLASAGGGVRIAYRKHAWIELEAARMINTPYGGYQDKWRFNVAWRIAVGKQQ